MTQRDAILSRFHPWTINTNGKVCAETLGTLEGSAGGDVWSGAWAINNDEDPIVVGVSSVVRPCGCNVTGNNKRVYTGFSCIYDSSPSLVELESFGNHLVNAAFDVTTPDSGPAWVVGHSRCWTGGKCDSDGGELGCQELLFSAAWDANDPDPMVLDRLEPYGHVARGVNDDERAVGWGYVATAPCVQSAVYWPAPDEPYELGDHMPSGQGIHASRAEAINNLINPQVVGWNSSNNHALLWEYNGSTWSVLDLQSEDAIGSLSEGDPVAKLDLRQAHDVNDDGWIICWGVLNFGEGEPPAGQYAVLLTPYTQGNCPADVNGDGSVNVPDLLAVIAQWGSCQIGVFCTADINLNFHVNVTDLLAVITSWGPCGQPSDGAPESVEDCHQACAAEFGMGTPAYSECMDGCIRALCESGKLPPEDCE